ncbi:hypothetical protein SDC9_166381 [bioreactor metagenome]|uniref:Uncharacterized protein n=1 Tax=bioreactor metagenome TaxID=1076179 RepID=A0A645FX48_9ZZZZ
MHRLVIDLDPAEVLVLLFLARRQLQWAEDDRFIGGADAELVLVQVVVGGNFVTDLDRPAVERPRRGLEGDGRIEEFLGVDAGSQEGEEKEQEAHGHWTGFSASQFR